MSNQSSEELERVLAVLGVAVATDRLTAEAARNLERWLREPQYAAYRDRLTELVTHAKFDELNRLFWERIPFGTGGRRGLMAEFGSATINDRTIAESAYGLAVYVKRCRERDASTTPRPLRAAVAFDSRHRSVEFAQCTASVMAAHGFLVFLFPQPRATPELSFAVRHLQCDTGVMISASHNPPSDNGFKAYWSNGGQVLPPHDAGIIECVDAATEIPVVAFQDAVTSGQIVLLDDAVDAAYVEAVCALSLSSERGIKALYTPLHGVGETSVFRVVRQSGFRDVSIFEPQRSQDGAFPNVPDHLPNPERFAVFGPAIEEAKKFDVDLVLASDPDADRMAVAVRDQSGEFVCLSGNQLGALLTDYVLGRRVANGSVSSDHFVIETLVTTPLIQAIGRKYGVKVVRDVLVGFKHIAAEVDARGSDRFVFAAEESIGFMAGDYCRDKDAAIGALYVLELAAELKRQGQTLLDRLEELHAQHGFHREQALSMTCPGPSGHARITLLMQALRNRPPESLGPCRFETIRDFQRHEVRGLPSNSRLEPLPQPSSDLLIFSGRASDGEITLAIRPSGTEPKLKLYGFVRTPPVPAIADTEARATACLAVVMAEMETWMAEVR